jgi:hypothetical protein
MTTHGSISRDRRDESPEDKVRWFRSLPVSERMEMSVAFTGLALAVDPTLPERKHAGPVA